MFPATSPSRCSSSVSRVPRLPRAPGIPCVVVFVLIHPFSLSLSLTESILRSGGQQREAAPLARLASLSRKPTTGLLPKLDSAKTGMPAGACQFDLESLFGSKNTIFSCSQFFDQSLARSVDRYPANASDVICLDCCRLSLSVVCPIPLLHRPIGRTVADALHLRSLRRVQGL